MNKIQVLLFVAILLWVPGVGVAQCAFEELQQVVDPTGAQADWFGNSVSIDGDVAIVGANEDGVGSAFIYRFNGTSWVEEQKLLPQPGQFFGEAVAIEGDVAIVGRNTPYVFRYNGTSWEEEATLLVESPRSVSLDNGVVIVGAPLSGGGFASIFHHDGVQWVLEQTIMASDASGDDRFGTSVCMDGENRIAIVGAPNDDDPCCDTGSSYIFRYDGASWVEEQKITASDVMREDGFGSAVSVLGNLAAVGNEFEDAYVFRFDGAVWAEEQILVVENARLGRSLVFGEGGLLAVGAAGRIGSFFNGSVHIFRFDGTRWITIQSFWPQSVTIDNDFGVSVDISNSILLVGARLSDEACPMSNVCDSGSAYFLQQIFDGSHGTVNTGMGIATDVLFINGSPGDDQAMVNVSLGDPVTLTLDAPPEGPSPGNYVLYVWTGFPVQCVDLVAGDSIGLLVNPTPFSRTKNPQPFRCLRSPLIPSAVCRGVVEKAGPATVPWSLTLSRGFDRPEIYTLQGVIQDLGAGNATGYSVTNAVTVIAE